MVYLQKNPDQIVFSVSWALVVTRYSLEAPGRGTSNDYPEHMFLEKRKYILQNTPYLELCNYIYIYMIFIHVCPIIWIQMYILACTFRAGSNLPSLLCSMISLHCTHEKTLVPCLSIKCPGKTDQTVSFIIMIIYTYQGRAKSSVTNRLP